MKNSWQADVLVDRSVPGNESKSNYRDFSLMFQDEDNLLGTSFMPYAQKVAGLTGVNYRAANPLDYAIDNDGCEVGTLFSCVAEKGGLNTPVLEAHAGDSVMIHVFGGFNEQVGVFALDGHEWPADRFRGAHLHSSLEYGGTSYLRVDLRGGAGGPAQLPGDYVYMNHRAAYIDSGQWGIFKVLPKGDKRVLALDAPSLDVRPVSLSLDNR